MAPLIKHAYKASVHSVKMLHYSGADLWWVSHAGGFPPQAIQPAGCWWKEQPLLQKPAIQFQVLLSLLGHATFSETFLQSLAQGVALQWHWPMMNQPCWWSSSSRHSACRTLWRREQPLPPVTCDSSPAERRVWSVVQVWSCPTFHWRARRLHNG